LLGNKIHIYSVADFELKLCIGGDEMPLNKLMNLSFSKKNKFIGFLFSDLTIQIYNLLNGEPQSYCICKKDHEEKKSAIESFFSGIKVRFLFIISNII
jgi:hypothetical protein